MFCIGLAMFATRTTPRVRAGVKLRNALGFGFGFCLEQFSVESGWRLHQNERAPGRNRSRDARFRASDGNGFGLYGFALMCLL